MTAILRELDPVLEQRHEALKHANTIRMLRAGLKRDLKERRLSPAAVLLNPPAFAQTMTVHSFLLAIPRFGRVKAGQVLASCGVAPSKMLGSLTERQRRVLAWTVRR